MRSHYIIALAAVLSFSLALCSCNGIEKNEQTSSKESSYNNKSTAESLNDSAVADNISSEDHSQADSDTENSGNNGEISIDPAIGYVCPAFNTVNLYYERISDHEIKTLDGKLKGSFTYEINESENEIVFTTTYENLSDDSICADFRPNISFISDNVDNSNPIVTADFDGHTIESGDSYSFSANVEIGEYNEVMINYEFKTLIDPRTSEYGENINVNYVPIGSVFPFVIHLSK